MSAIMEVLNTPAKGNLPHVALMIAVPILLFTLAAWMLEVRESGVFPTSDGRIEMPTPAFLIRCVLLSLTFVMYYFIWTHGKAWNSFFGNNGVEWFSNFCLGFKTLQLYTIYSACFPGSSLLTLNVAALYSHLTTNVTYTGWIMLVAWLTVGQALNLGIYYAIGKVGVYYGFKMGHNVPWATGFPFSVVTRHPQYFGSCISFVGLLPTCLTPDGLENGLICMYIFLFLCYVVLGKFEEAGDNPEEDKTE